MEKNKIYQLVWIKGSYTEHIAEGSAALMQSRKSKLKLLPQYKTGLLTVISKDGLKYNRPKCT